MQYVIIQLRMAAANDLVQVRTPVLCTHYMGWNSTQHISQQSSEWLTYVSGSEFYNICTYQTARTVHTSADIIADHCCTQYSTEQSW